ncbi:hypothetical protein N9O83_03195 [Flavobacteriales bacterium]|nr:hypothetical protein [Flavobacteriales bacterium]
MKKILLLILFPVFLFSQPIIEIGYDNNDSLKQVTIVPFLSSHSALNTNEDNNNTFFGYGSDLYFNFSSKFKVSSRILKLNDDLNSSVSNYIDSLGVFPGMNPIEDRLTYFSLTANYKINKFFSTQFGKGKQFFGDGYRSMLLSNNHSAYPFLTFLTEFWKVKYYNHFTTFSDIYDSDISQKKHGAFHYLDFQANKNLTIGMFEGIIWQSRDENYERGFDVHYLNPIIFYRPVEFSKHSPDNALMGLNIKYQLNKINLYGQLLIDDLNINRYENTGDGFFQNKLAYQLGIKSEFCFKNHEFHFLTEYNQAQPYTYAHKHPMQNYTHMNQALAHPLGANFKENIIMLNHRYKRWATNLKYTYAIYGADSLGTHYGQNIFISDFEASGEGGEFSYGNYNGQGIKTQLHTFYAEVNYDLRVAKAFLACYIRNKTNQDTTSYIVFGIKTNFLNPFLDF